MSKCFFLFVLATTVAISVHAQVSVTSGPITVRSKMPSKENTVLIDSIVEITDYSSFVRNYWIRQIKIAARKNNWSVQHTDSIMNSLNPDHFAHSTLYNVFASYTKEDLTEIIKAFSIMNSSTHIKNRTDEYWSTFVPINQMIENNLEVHIKAVMKEDYREDYK